MYYLQKNMGYPMQTGHSRSPLHTIGLISIYLSIHTHAKAYMCL